MTSDRFTDDAEVAQPMSSTAHLLEELALYAHRPYDDEADPRPLPEPARLQGALADMFDALVATLSDTRLEPDLHTLLWSLVNVFHRRIDRIERDLDANESAQRMGQREQDGSEVRSVELERLVAQGLTLIERRNSFEFLRDAAAELYGIHTGQAWRPRTGSMVNRATMTAAMVDSREFINARRRADAQVLLPKGTRIAFAGGVDCNDHQRIWAVLDKVQAKHSDMVLLHGGTQRGAEKIAACWADARKVSQVVFKPDWTRHQKAAPFKRNDQLLEALPIGVVVFPGSGVTDNLADKAKAMSIRCSTSARPAARKRRLHGFAAAENAAGCPCRGVTGPEDEAYPAFGSMTHVARRPPPTGRGRAREGQGKGRGRAAARGRARETPRRAPLKPRSPPMIPTTLSAPDIQDTAPLGSAQP